MGGRAFVTDTHPLVFFLADRRGLSRLAADIFRRCEERAAIVYVPVVVLWELSLLVRLGRVRLETPWEDLYY